MFQTRVLEVYGVFFFNFVRWIDNHSQEDLANFGFRLKKESHFLEPCCIWRHAITYCLNLVIFIKKKDLRIWRLWAIFPFVKNPLYESCNTLFCCHKWQNFASIKKRCFQSVCCFLGVPISVFFLCQYLLAGEFFSW